jgi:hypothetical protein
MTSDKTLEDLAGSLDATELMRAVHTLGRGDCSRNLTDFRLGLNIQYNPRFNYYPRRKNAAMVDAGVIEYPPSWVTELSACCPAIEQAYMLGYDERLAELDREKHDERERIIAEAAELVKSAEEAQAIIADNGYDFTEFLNLARENAEGFALEGASHYTRQLREIAGWLEDELPHASVEDILGSVHLGYSRGPERHSHELSTIKFEEVLKTEGGRDRLVQYAAQLFQRVFTATDTEGEEKSCLAVTAIHAAGFAGEPNLIEINIPNIRLNFRDTMDRIMETELYNARDAYTKRLGIA